MRTPGVLLLALIGCTDAIIDEPSEPNQLRDDGKADDDGPLWAGLTSVTLERWVPDPCNNGQRSLGDAPVGYGDWERQRAGIRNLCFEVWRPGVTDWENPDFWKQLDVRVHHRFGSDEFAWAHVPSIDRRGNNRRYAWALEYRLDPMVASPSLATMKMPIEILSESGEWARVAATMDVFFTVNGRVLNAPSNRPFAVRYEGFVRTPKLEPKAGGYVLHDIVTCDGARFGSGAGHFAADITDADAVDTLGAGFDGSLIYGARIAKSGGMVSAIYGTQVPVANEALPGFVDEGGLRVIPQGTSMRVELDVYDRALGASRKLVETFANCVEH